MISPSEIRINNWYNYTDQKISVWKRIDAAMMASIFSDTGKYALNDFEGIPITPEILAELRFTDNIEIGEIKYLHQLQNLYFDFTGKEIELSAPICM